MSTQVPTFETCSNARDALILAPKLQPDVVILEYRLPDANGITLLQKLMRISPNLIAIVLSEYDFQSVAHDLVRVNVAAFLKKPFDVTDFESSLSSACSDACLLIRDVSRQPGIHVKGVPASTVK
jgi:DNA-binding NarL/FixJ family response regulator